MKINMQINIEDLKKFLDLGILGQKLSRFFIKRLQVLAAVFMFLLTLFLVFIWYNYIFHSDWNEARIKEYIQTKQSQSNTVFNRENFEKVIEKSNARSVEFEKPLENLEDIFRLNK
jgi:hypothetical protein